VRSAFKNEANMMTTVIAWGKRFSIYACDFMLAGVDWIVDNAINA
jgi:hypothetical protein